MEIVFKNKKRIEITEEEVQLIAKRIIDGCENFQVFSDKKSGRVISIINLSEVVYII